MKRFLSLCLLACVAGYISLTQEMLWFRIVSYITAGVPVVFSQVLGSFLLGAAAGAMLGNRVSKRSSDPYAFLSRALAAAAVVYFFMIPFSAWLFEVKVGGMAAIYVAVALTAMLSGTVLPIVCQIAIRDDGEGVGMSMSFIYAANIVGATLGPLLTGFVLLNYFTLSQLALGVSVATVAVAAIVSIATQPLNRPGAFTGAVACLALALTFWLSHDKLYASLLEKFHFKHELSEYGKYKHLIENRHGIIAVHPTEKRLPGYMADVIYGGGIFDGAFNIDPVHDTNGIVRAYMAATLHKNPERVLVIGLSSGSWARVMLDDPRVKVMDVVEINPGYLDLIKIYPEQSKILTDPRVTIHVDDARRWLNRHPDRKYDFILMNTSFHWRDGSTNLLSKDFLEICKRHFRPGGVVYYNSTGSKDVKWTAANVFQHATEFLNFVAGSDAPFDMGPEERLERLKAFQRDGKHTFDDTDPNARHMLDTLVMTVLPDLKTQLAPLVEKEHIKVITDDNLVTEFKPRERHWVDEAKTWSHLFARVKSAP